MIANYAHEVSRAINYIADSSPYGRERADHYVACGEMRHALGRLSRRQQNTLDQQ